MELPATALGRLKPGSKFRRPEGAHQYLVGSERIESCGNVQIYCYNLTNGNAYFWSDHAKVIPIVREVPTYAEDHYCPTSTARQPYRPDCKPEFYSSPFWMCAVEDGGPPTVRHSHRDLAESEAERLAKLTRKPVYVLKTVGRVSLEVVPVTKKLVWSK